MVMHVVYIVVFKYTTVFLVFEWSPMTEHYQRSSLSLSDVWLLGNVTRYPYDLQSHESDDLSWCTVRRERAVNLAKQAVLVHRNLQTVARRGRTCHGDSAPNLSKVTSLWKMIEASLDFFRLCFFVSSWFCGFVRVVFSQETSLLGFSFLWLQSTTIAACVIINCLPRGFLKWGVPPKIPPKSSILNQMLHCTTNHPAIGVPLIDFYGCSLDFLWISMDFYGFLWKPDGIASRPRRGLARHPVLPSGRSGSGATPAGDLRFGPQREPGEPRRFPRRRFPWDFWVGLWGRGINTAKNGD